ncbi:MAG: ABC transporter permease [Clostridia bacterium]|nr:ABC transporter permease [Clostridia bacterium]
MNISAELFKPANRKNQNRSTNIVRPSLTYWQDVWRRLRKNRVAMVSLCVIILITLISIAGPMFSPYSYSDQLKEQEGLRPCPEHPLGTDTLGRDMLVRVLYGARISLSVGIVASIINLVIGVLYGGIAGYFGGRVDSIMMRIVDILYVIPLTLYVILLMVIMDGYSEKIFSLPFLSMFRAAGPALISVYIALGLTYWLEMARIIRGQVLSLKEQEYVTAARALGAGHLRILLRHLIPNCIGSVIVIITLQIPSAIFTEAFLSFIGLGVDAPMASLGSLASDAAGSIRSYFYLLVSPSVAICLIILAFNLFGDGIRDALDPRMRK